MWRRGSTRVGGTLLLLLRFIGLLVLVARLGEFGVQRAVPMSQGTHWTRAWTRGGGRGQVLCVDWTGRLLVVIPERDLES